MKHATAIDTIGIQIDCNDATEQQYVLTGLLDFIIKADSLYLQNNSFILDSNVMIIEYCIYANNTIVAKINTGIFRTGKVNNYVTKYYINVTFAGLKRCNEVLDAVSMDSLLRVCAYFNVKNIKFKLTELDICIDVDCPFEHMLAICIKKTPKTKYYTFNDRQAYSNTTYIEKISIKKLNSSVSRAYYYDKRAKQNLDYDRSRFELKLQHRYFNKYGFDTKAIQNALNRYYVMYFKNIGDRNAIIEAYNGYEFVREKEAIGLDLHRYRIYPDIDVIQNFIKKMFNAFPQQFIFHNFFNTSYPMRSNSN
jgi:hypothetical protein